MRVLTVGLKSQNEMAKVNSAVGILSHLGTTHKSEIKTCVQKLLQESEDPFVIPFFINLSSLSDLMATIVMNVITKVISLEYAEKISELMPIWEKESIGKIKHALKKYDQFALNTSCFWGKYRIKYCPSCAISRNFSYINNE